MYAQTLKRAMQEEARLLNDYAANLRSLQQTIGSRNWEAVERQIVELRGLAGNIESVEARRVEAFRLLKSSLHLPSEETFDQVASRLVSPDREELMELHRKLRLAIIRVKGSSGLLGYYVSSMADTRRQVLEELFPHRKGRLYSRSGRTRATADESIMLDHKY